MSTIKYVVISALHDADSQQHSSRNVLAAQSLEALEYPLLPKTQVGHFFIFCYVGLSSKARILVHDMASCLAEHE